MAEKRWFQSYPKGVEATINIKLPEMSLVDILENAIKEKPDHLALVFEEVGYSYKEFGTAVKKIASSLQGKGVKKGTRIALMMNNCPDLVFSYYAILYCGGVVVLTNPMYKERELTYQLNDSGAEFLLIENRLLTSLPIKGSIENIIVSGTKEHSEYETLYSLMENGDENINPTPLNPKSDIAVLQYTGGTTGLSKGVILTHHNLASNLIQVDKFMGVKCKNGEEIILNAVPLFHSYGMTICMNYSIYQQSTLYLVERFNARKVLSLINDEKITMFPGTPTIYVALNADENISQYDLSSVHTCISGSSTLSSELKNKFEKLTGVKLVDSYGLSETSPLTHSNPVNGVQKPGSMGLPLPGTDCKIVDLNDGMTEVGVNELGEILIKGPQVMLGYWNRKEETAMTLRDGWLYTGDIAYMDEDGYCFIVSRKKEVIIASGYNVYPREVEEVLYGHNAVQEVVVCGIPDAYRGESVKAFVVKKKDCQSTSEEDLMEHCRGRLAKFKVPSQIEFRRELPKSSVGKILRRKLIEEVAK